MSNLHEIPISVFGQPEAGQPRTFVTLSQDENGRLLRFKVIGGVTIPEGATAALVGTKPDGNVYSTTGTIDGNNVIIQEDIQMTAVAGTWDAKLDIVSGTNNILSSIIRFLIVRNTVTAGSIPSDSQLDGIVAECKSYAEAAKNEAYGSPLTASTAAGMTDKQRVYVYTGSETGYTSGHWYYWDGTAWTDGGVYNSVAVDTDTTLSIAGKAADAKETGDQITELKSGLTKCFDYDTVTLITALLEGMTTIADNYINDQGDLVSSTAYDCYYFVAPHDLKIWGDTDTISGNAADLQLKVYSGTPISSETSASVRYRLRYYKDGTLRTNTLPTEENPLSVSQGQIVLCAVSDNLTFKIYATGYDTNVHMKNTVVLNDAQIEQIKDSSSCKIVYTTPTQTDATEQLNIFIPRRVGYAKYLFTRTQKASINADVWRIDHIDAVDDTYVRRFPVIYGGEIEFAVRLSGRDDFSGGRAHGDEVYTEVEFWIDGKKVSPDSLTALTNFTIFRCCEVTNVYDPADSTTLIAVHGREYIFDVTGVKISQTLEWKAAVPVTQLYMAMYTPTKAYNSIAITNKVIFDTNFAVYTPANPIVSTDFPNAKKVMLYAEESAHCSGFELLEYPTGLTGGDQMNISDNGGNNYNKIYAIALKSLRNPVTTVIGDKLKSVVKYFIELGEIPNAS